MSWSEKKTLEFIDLYKSKSVVWDPNHKEYYTKQCKESAWQEIAAELKMTVDECMRKIKALLASYRREEARVRKSKETAEEDIYESGWFAYKAMQFVQNRKLPIMEMSMETDENPDIEDETDEIPGSEDVTEAESAPPKTREQKESDSPSSDPPPSPKRRKSDGYTMMMARAFDIMKQAADKLNEESWKPSKQELNQRREVAAFFNYINVKVQNYSPQTLKGVQHAMFEVLAKADQGFFDSAAPNLPRNHDHASDSQYYNQQNPAVSEPITAHQYSMQCLFRP